jgi:hypothetical protein
MIAGRGPNWGALHLKRTYLFTMRYGIHIKAVTACFTINPVVLTQRVVDFNQRSCMFHKLRSTSKNRWFDILRGATGGLVVYAIDL